MDGPQKTLITDSQLEKLKQDFLVEVVVVSTWAKQNNFAPALVYSVMSGHLKARRGKAHAVAVAVALGLIPQSKTQMLKEEQK